MAIVIFILFFIKNKYQGFILQYRTNKNTDWQDYKGPFKVSENNTIVYVKLRDTSGNESNEYQIGVVDNIDNVGPINVSYRPVYTIPNYVGQVGFKGFHKIKGNDERVGELKYYFTNDKGKTWYPENGLSDEIITDYTDFTPYDPGFPYIQYVHVGDINSSESFDLNFTVEYQGQKASYVNLKIYLIGLIENKINGEYQYNWFEDVFDYFDGIGELEEYTQRLNNYNKDNVNNFKTTYEEGYKMLCF